MVTAIELVVRDYIRVAYGVSTPAQEAVDNKIKYYERLAEKINKQGEKE